MIIKTFTLLTSAYSGPDVAPTKVPSIHLSPRKFDANVSTLNNTRIYGWT